MDWFARLYFWFKRVLHLGTAEGRGTAEARAWATTVLATDDTHGVAIDPHEVHTFHLRWLFGQPSPLGEVQAPSANAQRLIDELDHVMASEAACSKLLQRAPNVVPRLLKILRDEDHSPLEVAQWVTRDVMLSAEVMRVAGSAYYQRHKGIMTDMVQAIQLIGDVGLQQAIARVVLRPLFESGPFSLLSRCSARLWLDAERTARMCVAVSQTRGTDPFEAYMAGLLYNVGWNAVLRAWDQQGVSRLLQSEVLADPGFVPALMARRDRLMAILVPPWRISPTLTAVAHGLDPAIPPTEVLPEVQILRHGEWLAMLQQTQYRGDLPGGVIAPTDLSPAERDAYINLADLQDAG